MHKHTNTNGIGVRLTTGLQLICDFVCSCGPGKYGVNAGRAVAVLLPLSQINHAGETQQAPVHSAWG